MAERKNGLAPMPKGLFRPTTTPNPIPTTAAPGTPPDEPEPAAPQVVLMAADESSSSDLDEPQGRGEPPVPGEPRAPRSRRRRVVPAGGETKGRKLNLSDAIYDRLQLAAIQKRTTISAVAADILDRNLPRLRIERDA